MKHCLLVISFLAVCILPMMAQESGHHNPVFLSKEINRVAVGDSYHYQCYATDSTNNPLRYQAIDLPGWLVFNATDRTLSGKALQPGQYLIKLLAINKKDTGQQIFMLTVYDRQTTNILCIGNSITNGTNKYNSYRRNLWQLLHNENYNFDLIGSWSKHHMGGEVPDPDFDMDHDGHSGWTISDMFQPPSWDSARGNVYEWLNEYTPDIVLIELGTNDVFQCRTTKDMISDLAKLVSLFRNKNSHVKIAVAQIPPLGNEWAEKKLCGDSITYDSSIHTLNVAIAVFAKENTTIASPLTVVNQYTGVLPSVQMYDDIHPNEEGEKIMAERWFKAIKPYLSKIKRVHSKLSQAGEDIRL